MNTILQIFFSPKKAFKELKEENNFPTMAFIIILVLIAVNLILMIPITSKITTLTLTQSSIPLSDQQLEQSLDIIYKLRYLTAISGVFSTAIILFLYAFLMYIITLIAKPVLGYIKSFTVMVYSYLALVFGGLVNTGLLYLQGIENITNPFEIELTGLCIFTTMDQAGGALYAFLSLVNPFQLWFVVLLSIGLKVFTEMKYVKALLLCILFWLITTIFPVVSMILAEMTIKKAGFM